jgi:hypothetical protein
MTNRAGDDASSVSDAVRLGLGWGSPDPCDRASPDQGDDVAGLSRLDRPEERRLRRLVCPLLEFRTLCRA